MPHSWPLHTSWGWRVVQGRMQVRLSLLTQKRFEESLMMGWSSMCPKQVDSEFDAFWMIGSKTRLKSRPLSGQPWRTPLKTDTGPEIALLSWSIGTVEQPRYRDFLILMVHIGKHIVVDPCRYNYSLSLILGQIWKQHQYLILSRFNNKQAVFFQSWREKTAGWV